MSKKNEKFDAEDLGEEIKPLDQKARASKSSMMALTEMSGRYRAVIFTLFLDIFFAVAAYFLARFIIYYSIPAPQSFLNFEIPLAFAFVIVAVSMLVLFDCYNTVWKYAGRVEFFKVVLAYLVSLGTLMLVKIVLNVAFDVDLWATLIIIFLILSAVSAFFIRFSRAVFSYIKHLRFWVDEKSLGGVKRTIVIGAGYTGCQVINRFINNPHEGYFPVAVLDDDSSKLGRKVYGIKIEGGVDRVTETAIRYRAQAIVIAISSLTKMQLKELYTKCSVLDLPIKIAPAISDMENMSGGALSLRDIKIEELLGREEFKVHQKLIDSSVKDKVVCVTGGAGSIGSELCRQALAFGCKHLVIFDMHENGMFELNQELCEAYDTSRYSTVVGTVREEKKLREVFERFKPEVVFHAAAYKHVPMMEISATEAIKNNVFGTLNVINQAIESGAEKFVFISTDKAVNPANVMGASKRIAEMLIQNVGYKCRMRMAAVRFGNVLGSNGSVIPTFLRQIREGGPITLTDRNIKRYFMTIPEAVRLVLQTGSLANSGEVFVLNMGEPVYIYDLACDLIRISGYVPEKEIAIKITGLRQGEKLFEELRYDKESASETIHEGIFVTKLEEINMKRFEAQLDDLHRYAFNEDIEMTIKTIFEMVPSTFRNMTASEQINSQGFIEQGARS